MPRPKKRSISANSAKGNEARGSGSQSRITLDFDKLREAGWTINQVERTSSSGLKVFFRYVNPEGKTVKSAKDVERELKAEGIYERMLSTENAVPKPQSQRDSSSESDPDYEPPQKLIHEEGKGEW